MKPTAARNLSNRLAMDQPEEALRIAREIQSPWFKCQALSHVARYWPDEKYAKLLEEAVRSADSQDQVFNCVAVSAWPIRAYLERGNPSPAKKLLIKGTQAARTIENMGSRSEALFSIFQAARPFEFELWQPVFLTLVVEAEPASSWRQLRNLKNAAAMVSSEHPALLENALTKLSDVKTPSTVKRYLDEHIHAEPRPYFWTEQA